MLNRGTLWRLVMVGAVASAAAVHGAAAASAPPASGHAEVIAQGVVAFGEGPWHWQLSSGSASPEVAAVDTAHPGFLLADGPGAVVVGTAGAPVARLAAGEALFVPAGESATLGALSDDPAATIGIALVAGPGADEFMPGSALRDVDLVRDVLATNEAFVVHAEVSAFVVVTRGTVTAGSELITPEAGVVLTGDITLVNTAPEPAIVVAAFVGPALGSAPPPDGPTTEALPPGDTTAPDTTGSGTTPSATVTATAPTTTAPTTMSTTTLAPPATGPTTTLGLPPNTSSTTFPIPDVTFVTILDSDGDGLADSEEGANGCYKYNEDTDSDGLTDYEEVVGYGSNCNDDDSDDDGMDDYLEVKYGYDPTDPESHS